MLTVKEARHLANSLLAHRLLDPHLDEENAKIAVRLKERWEEERRNIAPLSQQGHQDRPERS
jgi:hypothetical protein